MLIVALLVTAVALLSGAAAAQTSATDRDRRVAAIHERFVFADVHAHPSAFHRANVERIESAELARY